MELKMPKYLSRYIEMPVRSDLNRKMVFVAGPRQSGKTTLAKHLCKQEKLVGSPLSLNSLREDLQVSHQSISRWIGMLENLYMIFRIYPFGAPKIRALKKEAKHYHLDWTVVSDRAARFENLVAFHLLKWVFYLQDLEGRDAELCYFRDVDKREVDFVVMERGAPVSFIECKTSSGEISQSLRYLKIRFPGVEAIQVVLDRNIDVLTKDDIRLCSAHLLLKDLI